MLDSTGRGVPQSGHVGLYGERCSSERPPFGHYETLRPGGDTGRREIGGEQEVQEEGEVGSEDREEQRVGEAEPPHTATVNPPITTSVNPLPPITTSVNHSAPPPITSTASRPPHV
ncbi:unnamed protein product [Arctogadus glacialis]